MALQEDDKTSSIHMFSFSYINFNFNIIATRPLDEEGLVLSVEQLHGLVVRRQVQAAAARRHHPEGLQVVAVRNLPVYLCELTVCSIHSINMSSITVKKTTNLSNTSPGGNVTTISAPSDALTTDCPRSLTPTTSHTSETTRPIYLPMYFPFTRGV